MNDAVTAVPGVQPVQTARITADLAVRVFGWLLPIGLFAWFYDLRLLDVTRAFPVMAGDWASYVAAPTFVRDAPWLSFPLGRIPGYLAPVGSFLGQVDAWPVLYPVYRALSLAMPHRPFQLLGWQILGSMVATFGIVRWYLRNESLEAANSALRAELAATAGAVVLIAQPYYLLRAGHTALFQMWVLPWALIVSVRTLDARREGGSSSVSIWAFLAPTAAAAALNPYLAMMVVPILCLPLVITARHRLAETALWVASSAVVFAAVSVVLGFIGTGASSEADGFGLFMADAGLLLDGGGLSRVWPNTPPEVSTLEGFGFPGTAIIALAVIIGVGAIVKKSRGETLEVRRWLWPLWLTLGLLAVWAMMPVIRLFGHVLVDLNGVLSHVSSLTASLRSNGRFVWPLLWMISLVTVRHFARSTRQLAHVLLAVAAVVQVSDAVRPTVPRTDDKYGAAMAIVREAVATGATRLEFQPPNVWTDCPAWEFGTFDTIAQLVVAGAVEGLTSNSGFTSRRDDRFLHRICEEQRARFEAGRFEDDVLYVLPGSADPNIEGLSCRLTEFAAFACRTDTALAVQGSAG